MEHRIGSFVTSDDLTLFTQQWWPDRAAWTDPKALVVLSHGFAEHSGRYAHLAEFLTGHGYALTTYDQRGHGRSEGRRGYVALFDALVDDLRRFLEGLRERQPDLPRFLLGHSVGGVVAARLALDHPHKIDGLILSSPYLRNAVPVPALLEALAPPLSRLFPRLPAVAPLPAELMSRDPEEVRRYRSDPLNYGGRVHARTAAEFSSAGPFVLSRADVITVPMLILHGDADGVAHPSGSLELFQKAGSTHKRREVFEGGYHELLNDLDRDRMMAEILDWMEERLAHDTASRTSLVE